MNNVIWLDSKDNVATVLTDFAQGDKLQVANHKIVVKEKIPYGHKLSLMNIPTGEIIYKYGEPIGKAIDDISIGVWVHEHNCESIRG